MHMATPLLWDGNGLQGNCRLLLDLATMALLAIHTPAGYVLLDFAPDEPLC